MPGFLHRLEDRCPVRWSGRRAVVALPEQIDLSNVDAIREQLLVIVNSGPVQLVADMTATVSCDYAGADALARVHRRAAASGTQLRLVIASPTVRRVLSVSGLDRLVSMYPSLDAVLASPPPAAAVPLVPRPAAHGEAAGGHPAGSLPVPGERGGAAAGVSQAALREVIDALPEGIALADTAAVLVLVNRPLAEMFGYRPAELAGRSMSSLIPAQLQGGPRSPRRSGGRTPARGPAHAGARLVGMRKDGATFPVRVRFIPVPTPEGQFAMGVFSDVSDVSPASFRDAERRRRPTRRPHR
jgi:anti-anti-sigma factor